MVGPVRTGKSTFIKKFMELIVIPNIKDESERVRATDELPQSAAGRTIMTTEPKFIPNQAVEVSVAEGLDVNIRIVDCVGYAVDGARGYEDENGPRMVTTPWFDEPVAFQEAAEIGTRKVIADHSTIGIVVTTDGSVAEIPREGYVEAEERVVAELKELGKPFVILVNSVNPDHPRAQDLRDELAAKYDVPVIALSCATLTTHEIHYVLREALYEFPVKEVNVNLPNWVMVLDEEHWLRRQFHDSVRETIQDIRRIRDIDRVVAQFGQYNFVSAAGLSHMDMGQGIAVIELDAPDELYDQVLTEVVGVQITGRDQLLRMMKEFTYAKKEYDKVADALRMVRLTGYGIAPPLLRK
ncbi:hypothetical protein GCM10025858_02470 [Alicyclobacillus sacchari]|nr:hypothetical protein GCM10025858_02470 [Alicyclobacillus sacchari]